MSNVKVMGSVMQIKSALTPADVKRAKVFKPEVLKLVDEKGDTLFALDWSDKACNCSKYGIVFADTDTDGKMYLNTDNPTYPLEGVSSDQMKANVSEYCAVILNNLNKIEAQVVEANKELSKLESDMTKNIEIV